MKQSNSVIFLMSIAISCFSACKDNDTPSPSNPPVNETELITTVTLVFTDTANSDVRIANFYDIDGPGGNPPTVFDTIGLAPGRVYQASVYLFDDTKNPADSISKEVLEEGDNHLFVFTKAGVDISFNITDKDKNNLPIGLTSLWTTGAVSNGSVTVTLKHQPGVKDGTAAPGETDVQIQFPSQIK